MDIKIKLLTDSATLPQYKRPGDAAMDLYADESIVVLPGQRGLVSTGISMAIPTGHVGLVWDRSGLAINDGVHTLGGVIDSNYRGEIKVIIINTSTEAFQVKQGDRIAQMLIQPVVQAALNQVEELDETVRGEGGFGSSGRRDD